MGWIPTTQCVPPESMPSPHPADGPAPRAWTEARRSASAARPQQDPPRERLGCGNALVHTDPFPGIASQVHPLDSFHTSVDLPDSGQMTDDVLRDRLVPTDDLRQKRSTGCPYDIR